MSRSFVHTPGLTMAFWAALVVLPAPAALAQPPAVDFTVSGTSTIRGWTCAARGALNVTPGTGGAQPVPGFANGVQSATITVPLTAFKCPNEEMTQHLLQAMKADKFSEIIYRLERYDMTGAQAHATGTLTITGVTQPITFPVTLKTSAQGVLVEGNTKLDMTTFGVEPPVVMLGMLKVGPQIRIEFKGQVAP